jgi:hypothetical protein
MSCALKLYITCLRWDLNTIPDGHHSVAQSIVQPNSNPRNPSQALGNNPFGVIMNRHTGESEVVRMRPIETQSPKLLGFLGKKLRGYGPWARTVPSAIVAEAATGTLWDAFFVYSWLNLGVGAPQHFSAYSAVEGQRVGLNWSCGACSSYSCNA